MALLEDKINQQERPPRSDNTAYMRWYRAQNPRLFYKMQARCKRQRFAADPAKHAAYLEKRRASEAERRESRKARLDQEHK